MQNNRPTILEQMQAVQQLQSRADFYLGCYQSFIIKQSEQNQFLTEQNIDECAAQTHIRKLEENKDKTEQYKSDGIVQDIEFQPRKINLSRIFNEICLGDQVVHNNTQNNIDINLIYQQDQIVMNLGKKDNSYNLSNFSSFNNNKMSDHQQFDIKDLLCLIQEKVGRPLNKKGIENIINQIQLVVLSETERQLKESQITQYSLFHSNINPRPQSFQHNYSAKSTVPLKENKLVLNASHYQQQQEQNKIKEDKPQINNKSTKQAKENNTLLYKRKSANVTKQIRIIKKNCFKNSLIMVYSDMKQLQNFCISNKIYGKDKQKIVKAIRQNKNIVSLD